MKGNERVLLLVELASFKQVSRSATKYLHSHFIGPELIIWIHPAAKDDGTVHYSSVYSAISDKVRNLLLRRRTCILVSDGHSLPQVQCVIGVQMRGLRLTFRRPEKEDEMK